MGRPEEIGLSSDGSIRMTAVAVGAHEDFLRGGAVPMAMVSGVSVGIVAQRENERAHSLAGRLVAVLEADGVTVSVDEATGDALDRAGTPVGELDGTDLVVSIGGDGTFLFVARKVDDAPLLGVNLGEVGFLNAVSPDEAIDTVTALVDGVDAEGTVDTRSLRRIVASEAGRTLGPALNEIVVHGPRRGRAGGGTFEVRIDGDQYVTTVADGVLVSTPTGSTAYNLSEGGPLVRPDMEVLVVTLMCGSDPMPSLVIDAATTVTIRATDCETASVIADGRTSRPIEPPATVTVGLADDPVRIAGPRVEFFDALDKLG